MSQWEENGASNCGTSAPTGGIAVNAIICIRRPYTSMERACTTRHSGPLPHLVARRDWMPRPIAAQTSKINTRTREPHAARWIGQTARNNEASTDESISEWERERERQMNVLTYTIRLLLAVITYSGVCVIIAPPPSHYFPFLNRGESQQQQQLGVCVHASRRFFLFFLKRYPLGRDKGRTKPQRKGMGTLRCCIMHSQENEINT